MSFLIEKVFDAVLESSGLKEKIGRSEQVIQLQQRFGLEDIESLTKFEDLYVHAVVAYAFDAEGLCKPRELVEFFKLKEVRDVFRVAYAENDPRAWLEKGQAIAQHRLGNQLPQLDPQWELSAFAAVFMELVKGTRSPKEIRQEQKLDSLQSSIQQVQVQIQQLPSLESVNQLVNQLAGVETLALPAAAQNSEAAALAHRLSEWLDVSDYDRDEDYQVWDADYFEWIVGYQVTRRRSSRVLVRGVAGEVSMADLKAFHSSMAKVGVDEGWLVGNRRVSKAARRAAEAEADYENITCYTFDELLDEDADFDKYLDWLEEQIKEKGVDVGYLPLACRKDDLDPVTQQKMGVSTYGEADGWIDGYVDMWLDDPAKEHLSVLGEFGTGKTWFSLHYAWVAMQRYRVAKKRGTERPRVPIVVPLRDYAKAVTVRSLFSEFFFDKHEMLGSYSVFEKLNRMGKLLLIFDGFDEMAARVNRQSMIDNFWELAKVVVPGAKAILTCRTEHFPDAIEGRKLFNAELKASLASQTGEPPQFEVLELEKFSDEQISALMVRKAQPQTVEKVMNNPQLLDLARRPVMVDLILDALPEIEAGKPVDMARVYLYAVTRKMEKDIKSDRTFTSLADKLYFLCELSWEMLSTDRMSLNYRDFPERLKQMFADRVKEEKELDHWRYDMMGQTMLIRNSEGDYSPAHRSLLEFFVAYKIVASLGAMAEDFTAVAREQSHLDRALHGRDYTWDEYFRRDCDVNGLPKVMPSLRQFSRMRFEELLPLLSQAKMAKAVLDLAHPMLNEEIVRSQLLPLLQATAKWSVEEVGYFGGNVAQLMLVRSPDSLVNTNLRGVNIKGANFVSTLLRQVDFRDACLSESTFSKRLSSISVMAYSPNGLYLAIGDLRGSLQILEVSTGRISKLMLCHSDELTSVAYSPDGTQIATTGGRRDNTVKLWDLTTGDCTFTIESCDVTNPRSVVYSPDGSQITVNGGMHHSFDGGSIELWDPKIGEHITSLKGSCPNSFQSMSYSPDGRQIATTSLFDSSISFWDSQTGDVTNTITASHYNKGIKNVVYSPKGEQIAIFAALDLLGEYGEQKDNSILQLWNVRTNSLEHNIKTHTGRVKSANYSPNGNRVITTGSSDEKIKIWDSNTGALVHTLENCEGDFQSAFYTSDGASIVTVEDRTKDITVWDAVTFERIAMIKEDRILHEDILFRYDSNNSQIATTDRLITPGVVKLWNIKTGERVQTVEGCKNEVSSIVCSPDSNQVAIVTSDFKQSYSKVKILNIQTGSYTHILDGHKDGTEHIEYGLDGKQIATFGYGSDQENGLKLWNSETGQCTHSIEGSRSDIQSAMYSPKGGKLIT
ncbi:MAG: NACHT domain-containing protein, partial [Cyanobacteria bacterium J06621_11]